jgi:putative intracellular protease/amidase
MNRTVLVIATSHSQLGATGKATGVWAEELAAPYYALIDAGIKVILSSPAGGAISIDPGSLKPSGQNHPSVERLIADPVLTALLKASAKVSDQEASRFDGVFFPGGHGAMWDLPSDQWVTQIVEAAFAQGRLIASVCHGAAGLVSAKRPDGKSVVYGLRVNSFTDQEETAAELNDIVPFALETRLRALGGKFEGAGNWQAYAVRDGQLITGQNPQSSGLVANLLVSALQDKVTA